MLRARSVRALRVLIAGLQATHLDEQSARRLALSTLFKLLYVLFVQSRGAPGVDHIAMSSARVRPQGFSLCRKLAVIFRQHAAAMRVDGECVHDFFASHNDVRIGNEALRDLFALLCKFDVDGRPCWFFEHGSLDVEIIGDMYQSILSSEQRPGAARSRAQDLGSTYTPSRIACYLADEALQRTDANWPCVFDPACGCGHLLLTALRRICARTPVAGRVRANEKPGRKAQLAHAAQVARRCIFGADIDPIAVALSRLMLDIETYSTERGPADLRKNIVVQDSLMTPWKNNHQWLERFGRRGPVVRFDVIISNPPYVRAAKDAAVNNRAHIAATHQYDCLHGKWDTWLPFVEMCWTLARHHRGVAAFVVSDAIAYIPYAQKLRDALHASQQLAWASHFGERFEGWATRACCVLVDARNAERPHGQCLPPPMTQRRAHPGNDPRVWVQSPCDTMPLLCADAEEMMRRRARYHGLTVGDVAYVSKGIELHSEQKHRAAGIVFTKQDLLSDHPDAMHPVAFIESDQVGRGRRRNVRQQYIEYGETEPFRAPRYVNRPTFAGLHRGPRLLVSKSVGSPGVLYTQATAVVCQNTVVVKRWADVLHVEPGMRRKLRHSRRRILTDSFDMVQATGGTKIPASRGAPRRAVVCGTIGSDAENARALSQLCSYDFLCGVFLSSTFAAWVKSDRRAMYNVTPEVIAAMPLPLMPCGTGGPPPRQGKLDALARRIDVLAALTPRHAFSECYAWVERIIQHLRAEDFCELSLYQASLDALVALIYRPWADGVDVDACALRVMLDAGAPLRPGAAAATPPACPDKTLDPQVLAIAGAIR